MALTWYNIVVSLPGETTANEGNGELYATTREYAVNSIEVNAIFNQQDPKDSFAHAIVCLETMGETTYEVTLLSGPLLTGIYRGKAVHLRSVDYVKTPANGPIESFKNQYLHFTGPVIPRIHLYPLFPPEENRGKTSTTIKPELINPNRMQLIIDWRRFAGFAA